MLDFQTVDPGRCKETGQERCAASLIQIEMSGRGTSRRSSDDDTETDERVRIPRRRPVRQDSSRDTSRRSSPAEGGSGDRSRRYRSPDRSSSANAATPRGGDRGRSVTGFEAFDPSGSGQITRAGTQSIRPAFTAAPYDVDGDMQRALEASQKVVPVVKDFDPDEFEKMIRKSKEEREASTKREEEGAERVYQEHLRYVKADGEAIKALDARKAKAKLLRAQEQEEADLNRMMEESLAAEAERQANAKAKLDALYAGFGRSSNDVQSPRSQAIHASQGLSQTPAAPLSRASSSSAVGRTDPSSRTAQQPQRFLSARSTQTPAPSPLRRSITTSTIPASRERDSPFATATPRQPASSYATPATREHAGPSRTSTVRQPAFSETGPTPRVLERSPTTAASRQPDLPTPRQPRRAPAPSETIHEADEDDQEFLAALAASAASHMTDQAQRGFHVPIPDPTAQVQDAEVDEERFAAQLQATLDESLGGADAPDATETGLAYPPPSYTDIAGDKILNHEKYTSAGGPDGSPACLNTRKEVRKIERMKKAQKAAAEEKRRVAQFARENAIGGSQARATTVAGPSAPPRRPAAGVLAGPSRSSSSAGAEVEQAEMMRPRPRRTEQPGLVAPGRRAPAPWNDAFASIAPRRGR